MRADTGGQTEVLSRQNVKLRHVHSAKKNAPQLFTCDAVAHPKPVGSSSAGSDSPKESGQMSSVTQSFSPAHISPHLSRASSREMKARNLRDVDVSAVQEAQTRSGDESREQALSLSCNNAQTTAPSTPSAARATNPLGIRAAEAVNSGAFVAEGCEQRQILDFKMLRGRRTVDEERDEGIICRPLADARDSAGVVLPHRFGEKPASPGASAAGHATVGLHTEVSPRSSHNLRGHSARSTDPEVLDLEEDVIKFPNASGDEKGSPQDVKSDVNVANLHHPRLETSPPARGHSRMYTDGQVSALARQDGNPGSSREAGQCLPRGAKSSIAWTIPEHSIRAHAMVKPCTQMSSHSSLNAPECSPPSTECNGNEGSVQCADPSYLPSSHQYPDIILSHAPLLGSTRGSDYESRPDGAYLRAQGRPAEAMLSEIDARDAGERTAVSPREGIKWGGTRNGRNVTK
ncbi:hypothetical protein K525DRAFT_274888 [Schizophyllum commune Loenen D]|nr:hypothetical protein K525DRAFT_274888 [Schizophyllum commune Loenen D]